MTKRPRWTAEEVAQNMSDDEDELDDPEEPLMEGSDDEFSDLELEVMMMIWWTWAVNNHHSVLSTILMTQAMTRTWKAPHQYHLPRLLKLLMVSSVQYCRCKIT